MSHDRRHRIQTANLVPRRSAGNRIAVGIPYRSPIAPAPQEGEFLKLAVWVDVSTRSNSRLYHAVASWWIYDRRWMLHAGQSLKSGGEDVGGRIGRGRSALALGSVTQREAGSAFPLIAVRCARSRNLRREPGGSRW